MIMYKVFNEEWEEIVDEKGLSEFTIDQILNCYESVDDDDIEYDFEDLDTLELVKQILNKEVQVLTDEQAKTILRLRDWEIKEIKKH